MLRPKRQKNQNFFKKEKLKNGGARECVGGTIKTRDEKKRKRVGTRDPRKK